jgi:hypothetical protein
MSDSFDVLILPLARSGGKELANITGLQVASPPRKVARFRKRDRLVFHLFLEGNAPLPPEQVEQLLANLASSYYKTAGTVTKALRTSAEALNQYLLDRNIKNSSTGRQAVGHLTQIVLREKRLSIAQSGLSHTFLLTSTNIEHIQDLQLAGNGLGLSRTTNLHYSQLDLTENDAAIISREAPINWSPEILSQLQGQGPESLRRKLLSSAGTELNAFLLHSQIGSGEIRLLRPTKKPRPAPIPVTPISEKSDVIGEPAAAVLHEPGDAPVPGNTQTLQPAQAKEQAEVAEGADTPSPIPAAVAAAASAESQLTSQPPPEAPTEEPNTVSAQSGRKVTGFLLKIYSGIAAFLRGILPDSGIFTLPPSTMAFTAIAVPLVIVAVAAVVYFQRGREVQYDVHITSAIQAAQLAETKTEPNDQRLAWETTLFHLDNAEIYLTTEESENLRQKAQGIVDDLNAIDRLEFRPAISDQLDESAQIIRIVSREDDLYMLNATDGIVERAILTNEGYTLDTTFQCGPGPYGGYIVGALVDIEAMPFGNNLQASILGIDANGNLLYCIPGATPLASPMEPPDINWGTPQGFTIDGNDLFILDPQINAIWIYRDMDVSQAPRLFFDQKIPPMQDVIDIAVNQNDLYLLHEDGHLTTCVYSALASSPTRCKIPEIFTDPRPGRLSGPIIEDAFFSEIKFSPPPEPTIYMLDPNSNAIYRFSVRLTLDRQFRSQDDLPEGTTSAFAVDRNSHTIFLAVGNQVYYAPLP